MIPEGAEARRGGVLAMLLAAGATYALSQTLILPAMPALVRELGASPQAASWLLTAYLVAASVATPLIGRLGDRLGRGLVLSWVMVVFCVGSVLCALSHDLALLVVGRILQGVAGGVFPLSYGIIRDTFPAATRMRAIGSLSISLGVGAALGPALAGIIVEHAGPSAIFWVAIPGALPALAAGRVVACGPPTLRAPVDWLGAALLSASLTALLILMTQGSQLGWTSGAAVAFGVTTLVLGATCVAVERRRPAALDPNLLGHRTIALTNLAALCLGCGIFMAYVPLAPVAQAPRSTGFGLGMSVAMAGIVLVPHGVVQILAGPWTGGACARFGCRVVLVAGATINALTTAWLAVMHGSVVGLMAAGAVLGLGQACALTAMATLTVEAVAPQDVGIATGINVVMRTIGMALGSALSSSILGASSHGLFASQQAYAAAFAVGAAVTAGAVLCAIALRTGRGESQAAAMTGPAVVADRAA